jgi:hypothetical protein
MGLQTARNEKIAVLLRENLRVARTISARLPTACLPQLRYLTETFSLSIMLGDLQWLDRSWYATHSGLLRLACRSGCAGIQTQLAYELCDFSKVRYVFRATVFRSSRCKGFVGYGDADPSNVSQLVRGAEMRVAETRAVNRALRKAYGIGLCSVEELGAACRNEQDSTAPLKIPPQPAGGSGVNGRKVRDQLCQIIRHHQLDPNLVKAYAVDYCGVKTLKEASREQVQNFVKELSEWAEKDRNALLCQLNSYLGNKEGAA